MRTLVPLVSGGIFFEGPRWHEGAWWVSDFFEQVVRTVTPAGDNRVVVELPDRPSGLGWMPDGTMLVVSMTTARLLRWTGDRLLPHADLSGHCDSLINDMTVDEDGRAYVGEFGYDYYAGEPARLGNLYCVLPDGSVTVAASALAFPNGVVITPNGKELIVAESDAARFTRFRIGTGGSLSERSVVADGSSLGEFGPDGISLDEEGCLWAADTIGRRCCRIHDGEIVEAVGAPEGLTVYACMLGGEDGRTLLLCVAPDDLPPVRIARKQGALLTTRVDVPGVGLP